MRNFDYLSLVDIKYDIETLNLIKEINRLNGKVEIFLKQKNEYLESYKFSARLHSVESSNRIEGICSTKNKIRSLIDKQIEPETRNEQEIMGYNDVLDVINESFEFINVDTNHILQLHKILTSRFNNNFGGKLKSSQNYIVQKDNGETSLLFTPIEPAFTKEAMDSSSFSFNIAFSDQRIDKLILIFSYILDFLCIHPFDDGNGRTSRLLTNMLLYKAGFIVPMYISLERHIEETKEYYYKSLLESENKWKEGENDSLPFIKYMLRTLLSCYNEFMDRYVLIQDNPFMDDIVKELIDSVFIGKFTKSMILDYCPFISYSSVEKSLRNLVSKKLITRYGSGKSIYYIKNN